MENVMATTRKAPASKTVGQPTELKPVQTVRVTSGRAALKVPHLSPAEREAMGKEARRRVPRSSHAEVPFPGDRADPVGLLEQQALTRVPELVPVRYGRMVSSPFAFYRGAARVMAADLARTPDSGIKVQACGDAHLSNFGVFASP